ncbi:MAG: nodulation protein NfeD [Burkholderiaceae bacterium]
MGKSTTIWLSWLVLACGLLIFSQPQAQSPDNVVVLEVRGTISPATSEFIIQGIDKAEASGAGLLVLEMDTPGGLDASMRAIIKRMLSANVPIAVYVAPGGARAASAGTFILYASHVAAMTPASNLGAASPVAIGGMSDDDGQADDAKKGEEGQAVRSQRDTMAAKATNDAAAYLRSLAQLRDRDPDFAEAAVREARSMSAQEALEGGVIEYVAPTLESLLGQLDGHEIKLDNGETITLATQGAQVERVGPDWRMNILSLLANPQIAVILMMLGIYGLFFEMMSPGAALPGVAGLICLLLGLYGMHMLPVNWAGVALLGFGMLMMIGELFLPSFGALGIGGLLAFVLGGLFMTGPDVPKYYELSIPFLISMGLASAAIIIGTGTLALRSRKVATVSGHEAMLGEQGTVVGTEGGMVYAEIGGENWRVACSEALQPGDQVSVTGIDGLKLRVDRVNSGADGSLNGDGKA